MGHTGVAVRAGPGQALLLDVPRGDHPPPHHLRRFSGGSLLELAPGQARNLDLDIYAVEQRSGYARAVPLDISHGADAAALRITQVAARAGVHRCHQAEPGRIGHGHHGANDRDLIVLERTAQGLERVARIERELVEVEYPSV